MDNTTFAPRNYKKYYYRFQPMLKDPKKQAYLMVILSLLTIAFFSFFAIRPTLKTIAVLERKIDDKSVLNQQLDDKINSLLSAQEEYQKMQSVINNMYELLPPSPEFPVFLNQLETLAQNHGAMITSLKFEPITLYATQNQTVKPPAAESNQITLSPAEKTSSPAAESTSSIANIGFNVSFTGSYQNLLDLLSDMTQFKRLMTFQVVNLTMSNGENKSSTLTISLYSRTYYYPL